MSAPVFPLVPVPPGLWLEDYILPIPSPAIDLQIRLFSNIVDPALDHVYLDFFECNFPGYRRFGPEAWDFRRFDNANSCTFHTKRLRWVREVGGKTQTVRGFYVVGNLHSPSELISFGVFGTPREMNIPGKAISLIITLRSILMNVRLP